MGIGFFFSLGHSSVVLGLTAALAFATVRVGAAIPGLQRYGGVVGASISGTFLLLIAALNLLVLADVVRVFRGMRAGRYDAAALERRLLDQGLFSRVFLKRLGDRVDASWKMFPLGLLFGLGFDTATEVGLLAIAAGVATQQMPILAVLSLPLIFAAGMSLMDTADGAFMSHAYGWAFSNPVRKVYYNIIITGLSVAVALVVGTVELLGLAVDRLGLKGVFWSWVSGIDINAVGYLIVGLFVVTWTIALLIWRVAHIEERWSADMG
jgi:high-affinity nickel-transport protein